MATAVANLPIRSTYRPSLLWAMTLPVLVACIGPTLLPVFAAWLTAVSLFAMFKIWTLQYFMRSAEINWLTAMAYLMLWPGMDPSAFLKRVTPAERPSTSEWLWAVGETAVGGLLVWGVVGSLVHSHELLAGWFGLVGLALLLHFGLLHLIALAWRQAGVDVKPIMHAPMLASSVSDFWSHRWNLAFRDLAQVFFFRPFVARVGVAGATMIVFAISGLIHDLTISLPAGGGYGLPSMYFLVQSLAVLLEKSRIGRRMGLGRGVRGRLFGWLIVVPGAYWLFHPAFIREVILPTLSAIGSF